jgi:mannose-1-phosphate guanylyltransferase/mannose-1-phosphate guanylyltransferase/mannose-6-phosphate isomerase
MSDSRVIPVILAGGSGNRLWPLSREQHPKQLLTLLGQHSLIQNTALRYRDQSRFADPMIITSESIRFTIGEQILSVGITAAATVLEPRGRGTAPAIAVAALLAEAKQPGAIIIVSPSDHIIADEAAFHDAIAIAAKAAERDQLVTFAIVPRGPETGYGYIRRGEEIETGGAYKIDRFVEKPTAEVAAVMIADGQHYWNGGIFVFKASYFLEELGRHAPEVLAASRAALEAAKIDPDFVRLDAEAFAKSPSISVDYAVMEPTERAATVPLDAGWSDIGSWSELWNISPKDKSGNSCRGDVVLQDATNCLVISENRLTALSGVENLSVVVSDDAVLVSSHENAQQVKQIVSQLRDKKRDELANHVRVFRPWGYYQGVHLGSGFQVKRITVKPGGRLSLQKHAMRAEHWVVVDGTARVTVGDSIRMMKESESVFIPVGAVHRLENTTDQPVTIIEVQCGSYLGEDDIVRLEDVYGRTDVSSVAAAE